ncbi:hypothetical protein BH09PSE1_BH09PSE1_28240 [soil metagenome]
MRCHRPRWNSNWPPDVSDRRGTTTNHSSRLIAAACLLAIAACSEPQQEPEPAPAPAPEIVAPAEAPAPLPAPAATPTGPAAELAPTDPARAPIQTTLEAAVARSLGVPAKVNVEIMRAETAGAVQWAFVSGPATAPDGTAIDLSKTTMARPAAGGMMDGTNVIALLRHENGVWTVATMAIGPTDVPQVAWPKQYKVSPALVGLEEAEGGE